MFWTSYLHRLEELSKNSNTPSDGQDDLGRRVQGVSTRGPVRGRGRGGSGSASGRGVTSRNVAQHEGMNIAMVRHSGGSQESVRKRFAGGEVAGIKHSTDVRSNRMGYTVVVGPNNFIAGIYVDHLGHKAEVLDYDRLYGSENWS